MANNVTATAARWWGIIHPIDGDPPDISFSLFERIKIDDRVRLARAQLAYQKVVLQAQLDLLNVVEELAGFQG